MELCIIYNLVYEHLVNHRVFDQRKRCSEINQEALLQGSKNGTDEL